MYSCRLHALCTAGSNKDGFRVMVDENLAKIKPPNFITRAPRSISKHRNYWKASEYRNWLIFYSIPIMHDIFPIDYLCHHILLVQAIFILSTSISSESLHYAEKLIQHYCYKFEHYYDQRYMSANLHCLLHLPAVVRNLGPLFVTSCFGFETLNGQLLYLIKGTQSIGTQVAHAVHILQVLPLYATKYIMPTTTEDNLYRCLCGKLDRANETCIEGNIHVIGCKRKHQLDSTHIKRLHNFINCTCTQFIVYTRIRIHSAEMHTAPKKRNSYTIAYGWHDKIKFGEVLYLINILHNPTCSNKIIVLVAAINSLRAIKN